MSAAQRASVEDSCDMVLLKLIYLNICRDDQRQRIAVSFMPCSLDGDNKVYYAQFRNCGFTLIQAKNKFTAFMLLYWVCQKARNSKSA